MKKEERQSITVIYEGDINPELDRLIEQALEKVGFHKWASGFGGNERDIAFLVPEKEITDAGP